MSELKYNEPAERFAPIVEKSLYAGATAVMVSTEDGCWVHYAKYCERIYNIKSEFDKVIAHHKYKRCLAMAKWCESEENRLEAIAPIFDTDKECWEYNSDYWNKWFERWLKIAEKLKEGI